MKFHCSHHKRFNLFQAFLALFLLSLSIVILASCTPDPECNIVITSLRPAKAHVTPGERIDVTVTIQGCNSGVTFAWSASNGTVPSGPIPQSVISYLAPDVPGQDIVSVLVQDTEGHSASAQATIMIINVLPSLEITQPPTADDSILDVREQTQVTVKATCFDPCDPSTLTYKWGAEFGSVTPDGLTDKSTITYTAPVAPGRDTVHVTVYDDQNNSISSESSLITIITDEEPPPEYSVAISIPKTGTYNCPGNDYCPARVEGRFEGANERQGITVMVLVLPVNPPGGGWWIQDGLSIDRLEGTWSIVAAMGDDMHSPGTGDRFSLRALLVEESVANDPQYAPGVYLEDYSDIPYLAASERVNLDIESP
ncbi:MAG: hypothetical protein GY832_17025 [Chloroflexi bacterium]|nr:hypothetical protein [Chloroflexota bacterium]